jgi:regulator of protease activity HflC (stomatin/prohibitin superfamily)
MKSQADTWSAKKLAEADADSLRIRGEGEAESAKALAVLQQNAALANFNMKLSALQDLLKDRSTLILDQSTPPLDLLQPYNAPAKAPMQTSHR